MATMRRAIVGVFSDTTMAERAIEAFRDAGFSDNDIRYSGATTGGEGFFDTLKGWFSGEEAGTKGNVVRDLTDIGVPQNEADYYAREYAAGRPIVAVRAAGREDEAMTILQSNGSLQYNTGYSTTGTTFDQSSNLTRERTDFPASSDYEVQPDYTRQSGMGAPVPPQSAEVGSRAGRDFSMADRDMGTTDEDEQALRLREERLQAEKQQVQKGEVRLGKEVVEEQQGIDVPVRHEEVTVERRTFDQPQPTDAPPGQDTDIRVPISEEQVNVTKQPVETGEVRLKKRTREEQKHFTETTRREEERLEPSGDVPMQDLREDERGL
jgi:uncharacterized protein (TIGR02271 family)